MTSPIIGALLAAIIYNYGLLKEEKK